MKNIYLILSIVLFYVFISCSDEHSLTSEPENPDGEKAFNANQKVQIYLPIRDECIQNIYQAMG